MHLQPGETTQIARLFSFLLLGEQLTRDTATRQAQFAPAPKLRCFLQLQSRQEAFHATVFQGSVHWLVPRGLHTAPCVPSMDRYRGLVDSALARGDLAESLLALQVLLEAMGDVVLEAIDTGIERRSLGFKRLRRVLRQQEQMHRAFGMNQLENSIAADPTLRGQLREQARYYVELIGGMFSELEGLFVFFDENPDDYLHAFQQRLPAWLAPA